MPLLRSSSYHKVLRRKPIHTSALNFTNEEEEEEEQEVVVVEEEARGGEEFDKEVLTLCKMFCCC